MRLATLFVLALLAGTARAQTTRPASMPLAQGFLAAAEVLSLRQEVASMKGKIAELEAEIEQLYKKLGEKPAAKPEAGKGEAPKLIRLSTGMELDAIEKEFGGPGHLTHEYVSGGSYWQTYSWTRNGRMLSVRLEDGKLISWSSYRNPTLLR